MMLIVRFDKDDVFYFHEVNARSVYEAEKIASSQTRIEEYEEIHVFLNWSQAFGDVLKSPKDSNGFYLPPIVLNIESQNCYLWNGERYDKITDSNRT
jgi:hypothetical protein